MNCDTSDLRKKGNEPHKYTPKNMNKAMEQE